MTAPTAAHAALARLRDEMRHVPMCPVTPCTCQRFADLALVEAGLEASARVGGERDTLRDVLAGFAYTGATNPKDAGHYFGCHFAVTGLCARHCQAARDVRAEIGS